MIIYLVMPTIFALLSLKVWKEATARPSAGTFYTFAVCALCTLMFLVILSREIIGWFVTYLLASLSVALGAVALGFIAALVVATAAVIVFFCRKAG